MKVNKRYLIGSSLLAIGLAVMVAAADEETTESTTVYPAVYEAAHLEAANGGANSEVVVGVIPGVDGFVGYTTNDSGVELWTAEDDTALAWAVSETNPLSDYNCQRVGRHSMIVFKDQTYFAASCEAGNFIFHQTDLTTAEIVHTNTVSPASVGVDDPLPPPPGDEPGEDPGEEPENPGNSSGGYPTAGIVGTGDNQALAMFANGLISVSNDGDTWTDYSDTVGNALPGQPTGVPLEASQADANGIIYLAFTSGEVMSFDGVELVTIGDGYLEEVGEGENQNMNLPAVGVNGDMLYVGNQDMTNGASIFAYNLAAEDPTWEEIVQLDVDDTIVNKMGLSQTFGGDRQYTIFYTSNGKVGTGVYSIDPDGEISQLLPDGLGGGANEREVVSITNKNIVDNGVKKKVMLFGTQNTTDQARIYVMQLAEDLPVEPSTEATIVSTPEEVVALILAKTQYTTAFGKTFKLKVSDKVITKGDRLILYVNDKAVDSMKVKDVKHTTLKWKGASKKKVGATFSVEIGRRPAYGSGEEQQLSSNTVTGTTMKVKVVK